MIRQIGEGGMGAVWLAEHAMLGRRAALKVLHPSFSSQGDIVTRFFNEARAATAISDPGIVQIFDFGYHTDGSAYIVMELLEGETLAARLARLGRLPVDEALRIMRQVASSLGAAHARGIVHRDLKPENIFMVPDPEVAGGERAKVLDFGIAKLFGDPGVQTQSSAVMGTPLYMSPEQCRGAGLVDARSDVYAIGCVLFTLIAGTPPFCAEGPGDLIAMHLREPAPRVSTRAIDVPPAVDDLIARCLEKDPAVRCATGTELAAVLDALLGRPPRAWRPPVAAVAPVAASTTLSGAASSSPTAPGRARGKLVAALGGGLVLGGGGMLLAIQGSGDVVEPAAGRASAPGTPTEGSAVSRPDPHAPAQARGDRRAPPEGSAVSRPDPRPVLESQIKDVLARFQAWARTHPGAPCPDAAALDAAIADPWGNPIRLTCTDQPADQIVGVISAGPDGRASTPDDVASWQLGSAVTDLVRGARWVVTTPRETRASRESREPAATAAREPRKPARPTPRKPPAVELDEYGLPVAR